MTSACGASAVAVVDGWADDDRVAARPIVKWAGGKSNLLPEILDRMPTSFGRYYEPFLGGGALFFRVAPEAAELSDSNADLISMYAAVAVDVDGVIAHLRSLRDVHVAYGRATYLATRARYNAVAVGEQEAAAVDMAAMFIYLNKTCFNGLWRVNRQGRFNVPYGKRDRWGAVSGDGDGLRGIEDGLRAAADVLARPGVGFRSGSFLHLTSSVVAPRRGDFVYLDPPYEGTFGAYTASGFTQYDQSALAAMVCDLVAGGVKVMVSSSDTPHIRALYRDLRIDVVQATRAINSDGAGRGKVDELIITGGY